MTTPTLPEAARMALEALEWTYGGEPLPTMEKAAIDALRAALAASEARAEPVLTVGGRPGDPKFGKVFVGPPAFTETVRLKAGAKLYTHPAAPQQPENGERG